MKPFSFRSEGETFQLFTTCTWAYNSSIRMKFSSNSIDRARIKLSSSQSKDETFQLSLPLMKND